MKILLITILLLPSISSAGRLAEQIKDLKSRGFKVEAYNKKGNLTFVSYSKGNILCKEYAAGSTYKKVECFTRTRKEEL